jgi:ketosteroid isomerase-like protein
MSDGRTPPDVEEAVRRTVEGFQRRDFDAAVSTWAPDGVWDASLLGVGVFHGTEAIRAFFEDWLRAYEDYEQVVEAFSDLGNGVTLTVLHQKGRPVGSGGFVQLEYAVVGTWENGMVERATIYTDIEDARTAAERLAEDGGGR